MGNTPSLSTEDENEATSREAMEIFQLLDADGDKAISKQEWEQAFQALDADGDGSISRKEWYLKQGTTEMYDAIFKKSSGNITRDEWRAIFEMLDHNKDDEVTVTEWLSRRKVRLGFVPLGMTVNHWGVGVGSEFYEVLSPQWQNSEMVVAGPEGMLALGSFAQQEGAKDVWLQAFKDEITAGGKPDVMWLEEKGEPRARPAEIWQDMELCGWTMKTDEDIETWIKEWVEQHPEFKAIDALGFECNDQTFATAFISWLTNSNFQRLTDNTKGRAVMYGGLAVLAAAGGVYLAHKMTEARIVGKTGSVGKTSSQVSRTRSARTGEPGEAAPQ